MATKLNTNENENFATKKLWQKHQKNEYQRVDNYKEGYCFGCFKRKDVGATVVDVCADCGMKMGHEPVLSTTAAKFYGHCMLCGNYKFNLRQLNVRFCTSCYSKIRAHMKALRKKGVFNTDPFYKSLRRKLGKEWRAIMSDGITFPGI